MNRRRHGGASNGAALVEGRELDLARGADHGRRKRPRRRARVRHDGDSAQRDGTLRCEGQGAARLTTKVDHGGSEHDVVAVAAVEVEPFDRQLVDDVAAGFEVDVALHPEDQLRALDLGRQVRQQDVG